MDLSLTDAEERFAAEARAWLTANAETPPDTDDLAEAIAWGRGWQAKLAAAGWVGIDWPVEYGGRGASPVEVALFNSEYARSGAAQLVNRVGINLAGPTLLAHGTPEQCLRWLPSITTAEEIWCQLFSEPGAGSDLSGLTTAAEPVDGGWRVTGQKVWTSYAQFARWGLCLARSESGTTGPRGLSLLVLDMSAPGVDIRPLVQITGEAEFNEVFLDGVFVPADQLVGPAGQGWAVASTTLAHERGTNFPFKEEVVHEGYLSRLFATAVANGIVRRSGRGRRAGRRLRGTDGPAHPQLAHLVASGPGRRAGTGVELGQAHLVGHDTADVAGGPGRRRCRGAADGTVAETVAVEQVGQRGRRDVRDPAQRDRGADSRPSPRAEEIARARPLRAR